MNSTHHVVGKHALQHWILVAAVAQYTGFTQPPLTNMEVRNEIMKNTNLSEPNKGCFYENIIGDGSIVITGHKS